MSQIKHGISLAIVARLCLVQGKKNDLMVRNFPLSTKRVHGLIFFSNSFFFMDKMNGKKKTYDQLFQGRCPKGKGTFFKDKGDKMVV
jgi:hypothetical protein